METYFGVHDNGLRNAGAQSRSRNAGARKVGCRSCCEACRWWLNVVAGRKNVELSNMCWRKDWRSYHLLEKEDRDGPAGIQMMKKTLSWESKETNFVGRNGVWRATVAARSKERRDQIGHVYTLAIFVVGGATASSIIPEPKHFAVHRVSSSSSKSHRKS
jgi:hypothetical protein